MPGYRAILRAFVFCGLLVLLAAGAQARELREAGFAQEIEPEEVLRLLIEGDGPLIVDTRIPQRYARDRIPGAWGIYSKDIWGWIPDFEKYRDRGIVFYCDNGRNSAMSSQKLIIEGFRKVFVMRPGFRRWKELDFPLEVGDEQ